jgi:hypothetical protein
VLLTISSVIPQAALPRQPPPKVEDTVQREISRCGGLRVPRSRAA